MGCVPGKNVQLIELRSAPEVAEKIPDQGGDFLNGRTLYMAGYCRLTKRQPIVRGAVRNASACNRKEGEMM